VDVKVDEGRFGHGESSLALSPEGARTRRGATLRS
jgi:hypothetical protein